MQITNTIFILAGGEKNFYFLGQSREKGTRLESRQMCTCRNSRDEGVTFAEGLPFGLVLLGGNQEPQKQTFRSFRLTF